MINSKSYFIIIAFMVLSKFIFAQYHDANWLISTGYNSNNNNTLINFPPAFTSNFTNKWIYTISSYQCKYFRSKWEFTFITNGINIYNRLFQPILGGIVQSSYTASLSTIGLNRPHQYIFLPWPGDTNLYVLFYCVPELQTVSSGPCANGWSWLSTHLYYTVLDKTLNGGLGGIASSNNVALTDTFVSFNRFICPSSMLTVGIGG